MDSEKSINSFERKKRISHLIIYKLILFSIQMNLLIFKNPYEFLKLFWRYCFKKKNWGYNRTTVSSMTQKIFVCDMGPWYKNMPKIRNVTFIFQNFQNVKKNSYGFWKINEFIQKKKQDKSRDYL